ncbi:unnamed protein product [Pleuronectes platessa]|uniref:Uncharacterized protein n=1 Tax=Pleuronectes platessa TaxID=8262 RepID=A0A9N7Z4T7_PLEPL|nr:unnamed protein product [Pleuronectes platessa]
MRGSSFNENKRKRQNDTSASEGARHTRQAVTAPTADNPCATRLCLCFIPPLARHGNLLCFLLASPSFFPLGRRPRGLLELGVADVQPLLIERDRRLATERRRQRSKQHEGTVFKPVVTSGSCLSVACTASPLLRLLNAVPLGVLPTLATLAISCRLTLSEFRTARKHKHTQEHTSALLCLRLVRRTGRTKPGKKQKDGVKRTEVVVVVERRRRRRREGMNGREREKELMFTSHRRCRLLLLAEHRQRLVRRSLIWGLSPAAHGDSGTETWQRL